jgi:hypothetical protein
MIKPTRIPGSNKKKRAIVPAPPRQIRLVNNANLAIHANGASGQNLTNHAP